MEINLEASAQDLVEHTVTAYAAAIAEAKLFADDTSNCYVEINGAAGTPVSSAECVNSADIFSDKVVQDATAEVGAPLTTLTSPNPSPRTMYHSDSKLESAIFYCFDCASSTRGSVWPGALLFLLRNRNGPSKE